MSMENAELLKDELYSRESIERGYHKLTDKQWDLLLDHLQNADEGELISVLHDFMFNTAEYEAEQAYWDSFKSTS